VTPTARNKAPEPRQPAVGFEGEEDYEAGDWSEVDEFSAASAPSFSFAELGAEVSGVVVSARTTPQRDMVTGEIRRWADGNPQKQLVITLATSLADHDDDDGERSIYVKGMMVRQYQAAMKAAKVRGVRPGGELTVKYVADGPVTQKGLSAPKVYEITYVPPTA